MPVYRVDRIAFLALAEAQQVYHWLPAALCLANDMNVRVSVLSPSRRLLDFVSRHDGAAAFELIALKRTLPTRDTLFRMPSRLATLLRNYRTIRSFGTIVTTEISSAWLKRIPGFKSRLVIIKHGAGDREGGYGRRHAAFDLTLVAGEKDRQRMIAKGLGTSDTVIVGGYAKFEAMGRRRRYFSDDRPVILYNPHFDPHLSSWKTHGPEILAGLERLTDHNVIIAPHTKLAKAIPRIASPARHIRIDMGSRHSIDMSYTNSADIYLGDVSSQVYEFLLRPRPCIFLNLSRIDYSGDPAFAHWSLGQVIEDIADLPTTLSRAESLQPSFRVAQQAAMRQSIQTHITPASRRQAEAILKFVIQGGKEFA